MATFPTSIEADFGASKDSSPNIRTVQYGDGYSARLTYGLNQNPKSWNLSFTNLTETDSDTVETFLDARIADNASFDWTPPGESSSSKYICHKWRKSIPFANRATITATFEQVFEP